MEVRIVRRQEMVRREKLHMNDLRWTSTSIHLELVLDQYLSGVPRAELLKIEEWVVPPVMVAIAQVVDEEMRWHGPRRALT
jgi:hypothetical protein